MKNMKKNFKFNTSELIERERHICILYDFLNQLHVDKRGILRIVAEHGSGATRFLDATSHISQRLNYEVININGNSNDKLKKRSSNNCQYFKENLYERVVNSKKDGQIILIDTIDQIDKDILDIINKLLSSETNYVLALVYSTVSNLTTNIDYIDIPIYKTIFLEPLSPKGLRKLLNSMLVWDKLPDIFLEYLYNKTKGMPKYILNEIEFLIKEGKLIYGNNNGWSINEEYLSTLATKAIYRSNYFPKNNLPAETTEFVGREDEIREVCSLLEKARLVTFVGPGGIGKSRLALKVGFLSLSKFTDGVYWISLSQITKSELLISNIAKILNIVEIEGNNTLDSIKRTLKNKRLLMILDNFEQIIDSAPVLAELLATAANLSLLVTSRQPLKVYGEHLYNVPPLEIPDLNRYNTVESLQKQPAVSLFLARAQTVKNDFRITDENASQIAKLCACLEGIPLAIELAAANIAQISVQTMLNQSQNRLSWLTEGAISLPDRQRTMKNTIEWGYNLLSANQKTIFKRLGVFKGKFSLEAASAVINKNNDIENLYEDLLALVNKSILTLDSEFEEMDKACFNMLEILKEYAVLLLSSDNDEKTIKECHAEYFFTYAVDAENNFYASNRQTSLIMVDQAYLDIICALEYYTSTGCLEKELELAAAMGYYWEARGYWKKGQSVFKYIIQKQNNSINTNYVKAYQWFGRFAFLNGNYDEAVDIFEQGLKLAIERNDLIGEASIRYNLALTYNISGNLKYEVELLNQSLSAYREADYKRGIAEVLQELGQVNYFKGAYDTAEMYLNESLDIYKGYNDKYGILRTYGRMGLVLRGKGEFHQAMEMFHKYLLACEEIDDRVEIAFALINIAELARSQSDYAVAESYYLRGLNLGYELGYMTIIAYIKKDLGEICHYKGQLDKASELFEESLTMLEETGYKGDVPWVYRNMAELELTRENYLKAQELFLTGLKFYIDIKQNTLSYIFLVFEGLAAVSAMIGDYNRAACLYSAANNLFKTVGNLLAVNDINSFNNRLNFLRSKMDASEFEISWNEGKSMSLEHAIGYALDDKKYDRAMANKMITYINENYDKDISLTEISEYFNMSASYLSTMFKYYTGHNFKDYLNLCRVKAAKELMQKNDNLKINEIASKVGCNGPVTFIRMFRKYEGVSPGQYYSNLKVSEDK